MRAVHSGPRRHMTQTIDCAVIRYLVYAPTLPAVEGGSG